jgi:glycosyltransferase involved in cell wall biosynthesis
MNTIDQMLDSQQRSVRSIFVSTYVPRKCGIATFARDLVTALNDLNSESLAEIIAINSGQNDLEYPWSVKYRIFHDKLDSYYQAAEYVNQSSADVVCLQHEYGIYGGELGEYVFNFLRSIKKPIITTFHTILAKPDEQHKIVLQRLAEASDYVVAMIPDAKDRLERDYGIDRSKVVVIHHGVSSYEKSKLLKIPSSWKSRPTILLSGLISRNKGIEYVIEALPAVKKQFPGINFIIAGQTHHDVYANEGEAYRKSLIELAYEKGLSNNVTFINRYLSLQELLNHYEFSDIYITPHLDPEQITSGTLAYALGMGKACISTPYPYAKEMLSNSCGILVDFKDSKQISKAILNILKKPVLKAKLESEAFRLGQKMRWPRVAERYLNLFRYLTEQYEKKQNQQL